MGKEKGDTGISTTYSKLALSAATGCIPSAAIREACSIAYPTIPDDAGFSINSSERNGLILRNRLERHKLLEIYTPPGKSFRFHYEMRLVV
jgi:hypothetical protein